MFTRSFDLIWNVFFKLKYLFCQGRQVRIQHLKKVSQTNKIVVFPFISFLFPFLFISFYFIQGCLTSHMYHYQSTGGVRILDMPLGFFCYSSVKINTHGWCSNVLRQLKSWKLDLSGKIQILKYWLTANDSICII